MPISCINYIKKIVTDTICLLCFMCANSVKASKIVMC